MKPCKFLILAFLILCYAKSASGKSWRGIEPLHSTRADVERILGPTVIRCSKSSCIYDLGDETAFILYATDSTCKDNDATHRWRVPVGTVIEIGIHFKENIPLSRLGLDLSTFEEVHDQELPGWIYYVNLEEGVRIEGGLETASGITYFQSAKDNQLRCSSRKQIE